MSTIFVFLTPQPNDFTTIFKKEGTTIHKDIASTINAIKKKEEVVTTYQTCFPDMFYYMEDEKDSIYIVLSNGDIKKLEDNQAESGGIISILDYAEKDAIKEAFDTPKGELDLRDNKAEIKMNAMAFYNSLYLEENIESAVETVVEDIKQQREESTKELRTELDVINSIVSFGEADGEIVEDRSKKEIIKTTFNGEIVDKDQLLNSIATIIMPNFTVPPGCVKFEDTGLVKYTIDFSSGIRIERDNMNFYVETFNLNDPTEKINNTYSPEPAIDDAPVLETNITDEPSDSSEN